MDHRDNGQYHMCALRVLRTATVLPRQWGEAYSLELASFPEGHRLVHPAATPMTGTRPTAIWLAAIPDEFKFLTTRFTAAGARDARADSLQWRVAVDVVANLHSIEGQLPVATALAELVAMFPNMEEADDA